MLTNQRIIHDDNGTLRDRSVELNSLYTGTATLNLVAAQDKLYIGSDLPFNHRYIQVSTANILASAISSVEIWTGSSWQAAVDIIDQTSLAGATLGQSGYVSWTLDRNGSWGQATTAEDVTGISTLKIYDLYWARFTFSADLTGTTALSYVGHKFATDNDLAGYYPDLTQTAVKTAFASGKTTWDDQHFLAAEEIIQDLRRKKLLWSGQQVLDWEQFNQAGVHKVAALIMQSFGDDYKDNLLEANRQYEKAMNLKNFNIDQNQDGRLSDEERGIQRGIYRA